MRQDQTQASGWQRFKGEIGSELKRLSRLGSYEAGAALQAFPPGESAYRGDLGMLSAQMGDPGQGDLARLGAAQDSTPHVQQPAQPQREVQAL